MVNRQRGKAIVKVTPLIMSFVEPENLDNFSALEWGKTQVDASGSFMQNERSKNNLPKLLSCGLFIHYMESTRGHIFTCICCSMNGVEYLSGEKT